MRKACILFALLLTIIMSFSAVAAHAKPVCYRVRISFKGSVLIDQVVGLSCTQPPSVDADGTTTFYILG